MNSLKEFDVFCHFCGIGKKTIKALSYDEARQIMKNTEYIDFDEIVNLTKPCLIDEVILKGISESTHGQEQSDIEYRNWGSE
ncbi:MAG: hypothetical protein JW956_12945 [Calditrichaceae bacterium]|nr:hypothetical protein [Calditrichaceae bacterium]